MAQDRRFRARRCDESMLCIGEEEQHRPGAPGQARSPSTGDGSRTSTTDRKFGPSYVVGGGPACGGGGAAPSTSMLGPAPDRQLAGGLAGAATKPGSNFRAPVLVPRIRDSYPISAALAARLSVTPPRRCCGIASSSFLDSHADGSPILGTHYGYGGLAARGGGKGRPLTPGWWRSPGGRGRRAPGRRPRSPPPRTRALRAAVGSAGAGR